eukprot:240732-Chlamydomonas_euryale.AAC.1
MAEFLPRFSQAYCLRRSFGDAPPMVEVQRALLEVLPRRSPEVASFKTHYALMNKQHTDIHSLCAEVTQARAAAEVTPRSVAAGVAGQAADPRAAAAAAHADAAQERASSAVSTGTSPPRARTQ